MSNIPKGQCIPVVRRPYFDYDNADVTRAYFKDSVMLTQLFNAFSAMATPLEKFFIRDARSNIENITDPLLKQQVENFAKQEAQHSAEHHQANKFLKEKLGVPVELAQDAFTDILKEIEGDHNRQLRAAIVLTGEHMLGEFGHLTLDLDLVEDMQEPMRSLFRWHAYEEFEHNCIAIDAYYHMYGVNWSSYWVRMKAFWIFAVKTLPIQNRMPMELQKAMGEPTGFKQRWEMFKFNYINPGLRIHMLRRILPLFNPRFHPRKYHNVDASLAEYRHVVQKEWELDASKTATPG